ncbi:hypothetical protein HanIR_Chr15g0769161 [Helianthus annuus]|nr:hypothetical protein HanIR_Chr15g0769161 [Helianthus annuus]
MAFRQFLESNILGFSITYKLFNIKPYFLNQNINIFRQVLQSNILEFSITP